MNQVILSHFGSNKSNKHHVSLNYMDGVFIHTWADLQNWPWSHGGSSEDGRTDLGRTAAAVVATSKAPAVCPNVNLPLWENSWWFLRGFFWINFKYILIYLNQFFPYLVNSLWFLFVVVALFMGEFHFLGHPPVAFWLNFSMLKWPWQERCDSAERGPSAQFLLQIF